MDWGTAHSLAEGIRSQAAGGGYSGGDDGTNTPSFLATAFRRQRGNGGGRLE
jgi:hypothetical protein